MILFWNAIAGRQHAVAKEGDIAGSALYASVVFHFSFGTISLTFFFII